MASALLPAFLPRYDDYRLLEQGGPREDVQHLAGHADPRTIGLCDRRRRKISRNIVERISV